MQDVPTGDDTQAPESETPTESTEGEEAKAE